MIRPIGRKYVRSYRKYFNFSISWICISNLFGNNAVSESIYNVLFICTVLCCRFFHHWRLSCRYDDVIELKSFTRYCLYERGITRLPVVFPHEGQWLGAVMFSLICAWTNSWANNRDAGDLRRHRSHHDVTVMEYIWSLNLTMQWYRQGQLCVIGIFSNLLFSYLEKCDL